MSPRGVADVNTNLTRARVERTALALLGITVFAMVTVCASVIVSGWFAGVIDDGPERWFWAGAVLEFLTIAVFVAAAFPGGSDDTATIRRTVTLTRVGLVLFVVAPVLCIGALIVDFYG